MKKATAYLIPLHGLIVRDPLTKETLPQAGEVKPLVGAEGRYWKRRILDGSVKVREPARQKRVVQPEREETNRRKV